MPGAVPGKPIHDVGERPSPVQPDPEQRAEEHVERESAAQKVRDHSLHGDNLLTLSEKPDGPLVATAIFGIFWGSDQDQSLF